MKERPILFSAPMVRAVLSGQKIQTRRMLKFRPGFDIEEREDGSFWPWAEDPERLCDMWMPSPYGKPGDRLWVREAFAIDDNGHEEWPVFRADGSPLPVLPPSRGPSRWKPSIHMPRWASRITLDITAVRVERLQDISEEDAQAEGVEDVTKDVAPSDPEFRFWRRYRDGGPNTYTDNAIASFASLWTEINGPTSWEANPWVWVVEFNRSTS